MPLLLVLLPLAVLIILNFPLGLFRRMAFGVSCLLFLAQIFMVIVHPAWFWSVYPDSLSAFFAFRFSVDNLTLILLVTIALVALASSFVGQYSIPEENKRFNFNNLLLLALTGMNAVVMVTDLFSLYIFIEVTAVASFVLISMNKDKSALEGAFKYLILSVIATVLMLSAIALFLLTAGDTSFIAVSGAFGNPSTALLMNLATGLFISGLLIKSGIVPFHGWLPDAYSAAPTSVSILLAGIVTKVSGVYVLMRVVLSVFDLNARLQGALMFLGMLSILVGALAALRQNDFKRMLAYSSISQVGYIILGLGCATPLAVAGAAFHFFNHAIFKSLLFVNAAAVEDRVKTVEMDKLGGLSSKMPVTGFTSVVALLSTAGIPPLSGFWSKLIIIIALWNSGRFAYASVALLASVITLAYFLYMQRSVFFGNLQAGLEDIKEAPAGFTVPAISFALIIIGIGAGFPFMANTLMSFLKNILR